MAVALNEDETRLVSSLLVRFRAAYPSLDVKPQRLEVTAAEEEAYLPILIREHGYPPLVIRNDAGEVGHPFKGVPLIVVERDNG